MDRENPHRHGLTTDEASAFEAAYRAALHYRQSLPERPARPAIGLDEAVPRFREPLPEDGVPAQEVIRQIVRDADDGLHQMAAPTFFGYVLGGSHPAGVAADFLVSAWGQNAGSAFETPSITGMERAVCDWVIDLLAVPPKSGAGLVTGGTVANMVGVLAGRHALLAAQGWNVEEKGLFGAPAFPVLIGKDAHSAPFAALRYAGLGAQYPTRVETDSEGRIKVDAMRAALDDCAAPPLVVLQAGQINTGAFDPFEELIPLVRERSGWVHVDGAFGLWVAAVPELAHRLAGVSEADSWAVDLHKWLNAPFDAGMVIVRDRPSLVATMSAWGAYLPAATDHWEPTELDAGIVAARTRRAELCHPPPSRPFGRARNDRPALPSRRADRESPGGGTGIARAQRDPLQPSRHRLRQRAGWRPADDARVEEGSGKGTGVSHPWRMGGSKDHSRFRDRLCDARGRR